MYGNYDADYVYVIDLNNMSLITTIPTGIGPYPVDVLTRKRSFAITRKTSSVTAIDNYKLASAGTIPLLHRPRSTAYNPFSGLALVSGGDKPMTSIIRVSNGDLLTVVGCVVGHIFTGKAFIWSFLLTYTILRLAGPTGIGGTLFLSLWTGVVADWAAKRRNRREALA